MAETHELRLKIDAAAAKSGSRDFTAAINAIKAAVVGLERDSSGAFTKLQKNIRDASSLGKVKVGVDKQAVRDLNTYAQALVQISRSAASSTKGMSALAQMTRGLSDSYSMARKTSEGLSASILKVNSGLMRQIQLASQARSAIRQVGTAPATATPTVSGASAKSASDLTREFAKLSTAAAAASARMTAAFNAASSGAARAAAGTNSAAAASSRMEGIQLSAASAMRRAEVEAARLSASLTKIGDVRGVTNVSQALIRLKASLSGTVGSALDVRKAMDAFQSVTNTSTTSIIRHNAAQVAAASAARSNAAQQRALSAAASPVGREMRNIASESHATSAALQKVTGNMRGLENAFSGTFQAGSLFRTMLGSLTLGTFTKAVFAAGDALDQFRVTMEVATGSAAGAMREMDYIDGIAGRLGINLQSARDNYSKFSISASIAGVEAGKTQHIFEAVSTAMSVLGKGTEDQNLAFMALEQMMSKGTVSSEELRRQLGERLPGAVNMMAQALKVTTSELQKMLKAGSISASDALPKFADVLMERFGPGLQGAMLRAGNNLQKFQNQITKFLETVAQSGMMQEMAAQFNRLTTVLSSGGAAEFAKNLGEGFAMMAEKAGNAVMFIINNIETIGTVVKAVMAGIVVRQVLMAVNAVATFGMQLASGVVSVTGWATANTAAEAAATAHSAALTANTAALTANMAAYTRSTGAVGASVVAQELAVRAAFQSTAANTAAGIAMTGVGAAAARAGAGLAVFSRGLLAAVPMLSILAVGLLMIPGAMEAVGLAGKSMGDEVEAAVRRSGVQFENLGDSIQKTASNAALSVILADLDTLENSVDTFMANNKKKLQGLTLATGQAAGLDPKADMGSSLLDKGVGMLVDEYAKHVQKAAGVSQEMIDALSSGEQKVVASIGTMMFAATKGQMSFIEFQSAASDAMVKTPGAAHIIKQFKDAANEAVQAELATQALRQRLVEVYGTPNDKLVKSFAESATQVVRTGKGMDDLKTQMDDMGKATPAVAEAIAKIFENAKKGVATGADSKVFSVEQLQYYDNAAKAIDEVRIAAKAATEEAATAANATQELFSGFTDKLSGAGLFNFAEMDTGSIDKIKSLFEMFQNSEAISLPIAPFSELARAIEAPTATMAAFREEALQSYATVAAGQQTYTAWSNKLDELAAKYNDPALSAYIERLRQAGNESGKAAMTAAQLARAFEGIKWPNAEAQAAAEALIAAARAEEQAEQAAYAAANAIPSVVSTLNDVAGAGYNGANGVMAVVGALQSLFGLSGSIFQKGGALIKGINEQIAIAQADGVDKARLQYWSSTGAGGKYEAEMAGQIDGLKAKASEATTMTDKLKLGAEAFAANVSLGINKAAINKGISDLEAAKIAETARNKANSGGGKGGGGKGRKAALSDEQKAAEKLNTTLKDRLTSLEAERIELGIVASGQFKTAEGAKLMAQAMAEGGGAVDKQTEAMIRQIDAAAALNEQLTRVAKDPVKEWMKSVPNWIEAGQQIEMGAISSLKGAISDFIKTGKFDINSLGESILGVIADVVSDKAVAELANLFGRGNPDSKGLGGVLGNLLGSQGDKMTGPTMGGGADVAQGGVQAGTSISSAMIQAGQQVSSQISAAMTQGGTQVGAAAQQGLTAGSTSVRSAATSGLAIGSTNVRTAGTTAGVSMQRGVVQGGEQAGTSMATKIGMAGAGGGGGGLGGLGDLGGGGGGGGFVSQMGGWGGIFSTVLGAFSEGGMSDSPVGHASMPISAFRHAPHFAQGTPNTSGIPAVLHPNEAVIPLSKGRKIGVEMSGAGTGGGNKTVVQNFNISSPDADSFRKSQKQIAADGASAAQRAMSDNR